MRRRKPQAEAADLSPEEVRRIVQAARAAVVLTAPRSCGDCAVAESCRILARLLARAPSLGSQAAILAGVCFEHREAP